MEMTRADQLIDGVLRESLMRDVTRGVGIAMVGKAAYNTTKRITPHIARAVTSPTTRRVVKAAGRAVVAAAPSVGKAAMVAAPIAAGYYAMRAADRATSPKNEAFAGVANGGLPTPAKPTIHVNIPPPKRTPKSGRRSGHGMSAGQAFDAATRGDTWSGTAAGAAVEYAMSKAQHPVARALAPLAGAATTYGVDKAIKIRGNRKAAAAQAKTAATPEHDEG